ncbi:unnamed protein product [Parnassius mnemosyne]|uniref:HTH psq-type domain-containing protein n=1 Tax=Parnassius mnemosyne TaxID=213953 RepID=A0AAV1LDP1_9NEOP
MKQAIDAVLSKTAAYRKAAHLYSMPQTTLERHIAKIRKSKLSLDSTPDLDFLAASTTNVPLANNESETGPLNVGIQQQSALPILEELPLEADLPALTTPQPQPGPSTFNEHSLIQSPIRKVYRDLTTSFAIASPQEILAIPTVKQRNQTRKNYRRRKTVVLTSTPYKIELEEKESLKRTKKFSNPNNPKLKKNSKKQKTQNAPSGVENTQDTMCLYCLYVNHTYLKSSEGWVACQLCGRWAHTACPGVDDDNTEEINIFLYCNAK